ncbi:MAG TPA: arylsulfotransferase family protein [Solirubrobacteraceae bacterium]|nr:arylsulfotransferase family protein [Solirubrobacteraceae bacterium]
MLAAARPSRRAVLLAAAVVALAVVVVLVRSMAAPARPEISVYPGAETLAASPQTTVTFRGVDVEGLGEVVVSGSRSGRHAGRLESQRDGDGVTFVPDRPFVAGERVTVNTGRRIAGADSDRTSFVIANASPLPPAPFDEAKPAADDGVRAFRSRPDLRPPAVSVETASAEARPGKVFVAPKRGATQQGPMIVDRDGTLVWFDPLRGDEQAFDFRVQRYRDQPVLTWWQGRIQTYRGAGVGRILDTSYQPVATVRAANGYDLDAHEFQITPRGSALVIGYVPVAWDLSALGGLRDAVVEDNVVQEIDIETGELLFEWHALGTIGLGESYRPAPRERGQIHDPFHLNSVALDTDGNLLVSARHTNAIYKLDRRTGDVLWRLGGKRSSFAMQPGAAFALQHDARRRADGAITLFDNASEDPKARGEESRGLALRLDLEAKTASVAEEWKHADGLLSTTQGSMQNLDGGGAFVGWGGLQPFFTEFAADGRTLFDARFARADVESYRAYRETWRATGEGRPSVVATRAGRRTAVWVSWNGATDVASWRVHPDRGPASTWPRRRFETAITLDARADAVVVQALDASGAVIGTSDRVRVARAGRSGSG